MITALDAVQDEVASISPTERQIVIAGPGSGKTQTVAELIARLEGEHDVDPFDELIVISFSNAATYAVDARLKQRGVRPATVLTLDALAGRVIRDVSDDSIDGLTFDTRVARASSLLATDGWEHLLDVRHLVVDEVQDIVGVRADFLLALLDALPTDAGFSLFGDPAQSIYDFQIRQSTGKRSSSTTRSRMLLERARAIGDVTVRHLPNQYRARTREARRAMSLGDALPPLGGPEVLDSFIASVVKYESVEAAATALHPRGGRTAFLTRHNGGAMLVAQQLERAGYRCELRRGAHQRVIAKWVSLALMGVATHDLTQTEFAERLAAIASDSDPDPLWRALRAIGATRGPDVDLRKVADAVKSPYRLPPDFLDAQAQPFIVSTVHRAKGLEFDNVVLVEAAREDLEPDELLEERYREKFVAVSRAREILLRASATQDRRHYPRKVPGRHGYDERWIVGGSDHWYTRSIEIKPDDVSPPSGLSPAERTAAAEMLATAEAGDLVSFELNHAFSTLDLPVFDLALRGIPIAQTNEAFGAAFVGRFGTMQRRAKPWPPLRSKAISSVASTVAKDPAASNSKYGFCLVPVLAGFVDIDWTKESR